ncbi:MAG: arginase family protein [Deltaproteobacteria bacterium]|nr:arginase family protein [Deltaproteobacteria bacterium]
MLNEDMKKKWLEIASSEDFHMHDPVLSLMELRIHDDVPSMMQAPIAWETEDLTGADAVFVGIPLEGPFQSEDGQSFVSCGPREVKPDKLQGRSGTWDSPDYIRKCSKEYNLPGTGGHYPEIGSKFRLVEHIEIMDYGNVALDTIVDTEEAGRRAISKVGDIVKAGAVPLVFGGDHSIPYPVVRAISDNTEGKTGIIWFDKHYDIDYGGKSPRPYNTFTRLNAGNAMYRILESCDVDPKNICLIGIGGGNYNSPGMLKIAKELGLTIFTHEDVLNQGMAEVIGQAIEVTGRGTERTYITVDVASMDSMTFPAQKYPDPYGISFQEMMQAMKMISTQTNVAGIDTCCIGPAYDVNGVGGMGACRMYIEILKGLALKKMKKGGA